MSRSLGHWLRAGLASGVLACAGLGIGVASAGATTPPSPTASSSIHVGDDCTYYSTGHYVGQVTLLRVGNDMMVHLTYSHAIPNTTYPGWLFEGTSEYYCEYTIYLGDVHTNNKGTGSAFYVVRITPYASYFFFGSENEATYLEWGTGWNESVLFYLPPRSETI